MTEDKIEKIFDNPDMVKLAGGLATFAVGALIEMYGRRLGRKVELEISKRKLIEKVKENPKFIKEVTEAHKKPKENRSLIETAESIGIDKLIEIAAKEAKIIKKSQLKKGIIMKEDLKQRERRLKKELAKVRTQNANETRRTTKNRDFSVGGLPPDTTHKATRASNDVPDVILPPQKRRGKKENIPF
jgi:hypothetical protein|tara:strand:- start:5286 stop:5846 length:561 start_codon:yes stop_codon:yes gene_type:complete